MSMSYYVPRGTPYIDVLGQKFCPYCYSKMKYNSGYEDHDFWEVNFCDCFESQKELELSDAVNEAQSRLRGHQERRLDVSNLDKERSRKHRLWLKKKELEIITEEIKFLEELDKK